MKNKIFISLFMVFTLLSVINPLSNIFGVRYTNELSYNYNDVINMSSDEFYLFAEECRDFIKNKEGVELNYYIGYNAGTVGSTVPQYYLIFSNNPILVSLDSNNLRYIYTLNKMYAFRFYDTLNFPSFSNNLLDTSDGYKYYNKVDAWCDSTNPFIMSDRDIYLVNDACDGPSDTIFNPKNVIPDDTIGDSSSNLQLSYQYNEDNTSCHIDATLKGGEFTDQIYYSNIAPSIAGQGLLTKKPFPKAGIDITENQALYFQAEDKDGNIKATNSISINKIGKLTPDCFNVTFNFSKGTGTFSWVEVIPNLTLHQSPYYDIYYKIKTDNILDLTSSTGNLVTEYNRIDNNKKMVFNTITGAKFTIYFEIRNKDGSIALTKTYDINLKAANVGQSGITGENENSGGSGISGGTVNGENDPNITNNDDYISNYEKMSLTELIETAKESFNTFRLAFSILPGYIWGSILILLGVVIALRILGR